MSQERESLTLAEQSRSTVEFARIMEAEAADEYIAPPCCNAASIRRSAIGAARQGARRDDSMGGGSTRRSNGTIPCAPVYHLLQTALPHTDVKGDMVAMNGRARTIAARQSAMVEWLIVTMMIFAMLPRIATAPPFCDAGGARDLASCGMQVATLETRRALHSAPRRGERSTLSSDSAVATCHRGTRHVANPSTLLMAKQLGAL